MKRIVLLLTVVATMATMAVAGGAAFAQGNYIPMDPATLPQVPGCQWFPSPTYAGLYEAWCGSDEIGWYRPFEWYQVSGIWPPDYGLEGG